MGPEDTCFMPAFPAKDFTDAEDDCAKRGGNLTSVHNGRINAFLAAHFSLFRVQKLWLGGALYPSPNPLLLREWQWLNGSPFNYTNWAPGMLAKAGNPQHVNLLYGN